MTVRGYRIHSLLPSIHKLFILFMSILSVIIVTQTHVLDVHQKHDMLQRTLLQILIISGGFADDLALARQQKHLHSLYVRVRHNMISTITATHAIHPITLVTATELNIYMLRHNKDLEAFMEAIQPSVITPALLFNN